MKNEGKHFEEDFKKSYPEYGFIYRLRDSGSTYGGCKDNGLRFSVTNMCDFIGFFKGHLFCMELKSTKNHSLPIGNIRKKQIKELLEAESKENVHAMIIINFRNEKMMTNNTYAIPIKNVEKFLAEKKRKSIPIEWCQEHGIEVRNEIKVKHYKYFVEEFLECYLKK